MCGSTVTCFVAAGSWATNFSLSANRLDERRGSLKRPFRPASRSYRVRSVEMKGSTTPLKVGIAGAGLGGLATALALLTRSGTGVSEVKLFEPKSDLDIGLGAALNINGGAAVLAKCYGIDLWPIARPMKRLVSRSGNGTAGGGPVLMDVDVQKAVLSYADSRRSLMHEGRVMTMTVMRGDLQKILTESLPPGATVERGRKVRFVVHDERTRKFRFLFTDGSESEDFDLVIGADGIHSAVRTYVAGAKQAPKYSGIKVQFAVGAPRARNDGPLVLEDGLIRQWFGDGAYLLEYAAGPPDSTTEVLALCYRSNTAARENSMYTSSSAVEADFGRRLTETGMPDTVYQTFKRCERFIETAVHYHPVLKSWSRAGGCTLIGDAGTILSFPEVPPCHFSPPFSAPQAFFHLSEPHFLSLSACHSWSYAHRLNFFLSRPHLSSFSLLPPFPPPPDPSAS